MTMTPSQAAVAASGAQAAGNIGSTLLNHFLQKRSLQNQYDSYIKNARSVGATPSAIAEGLTGAGPASMPSVSNGTPLPDLSSAITEAKRQENDAGRTDVLNKMDLLTMSWKPKLWQMDINKSFAESIRDLSQSDLNKGLVSYYKELEKDVRITRPWKIDSISKGLQKTMAEYDEIVERTKNYKLERNLMEKQGNYYDSAAYNQWNQGYNESLRGFGILFDNWIRSSGWNPNSNAWENIKRISITDPNQFKILMGTFGKSLGYLDDQFKQSLGDHYKRNIAIGAGLYGLNNYIGAHKDRKLNRFHSFVSSAGQIVGMAAPLLTPSPAVVTGFGGRY